MTVSLADALLSRFAGSPLFEIAEKVVAKERLSFDDGVALFETPDVLGLGLLANHVRERKHGNVGYYNVNRYLNPTNLCWVDCGLCAWARKPGVDGGYQLEPGAVLPPLALRLAFALTRERADNRFEHVD